jgi:hypothetical protein
VGSSAESASREEVNRLRHPAGRRNLLAGPLIPERHIGFRYNVEEGAAGNGEKTKQSLGNRFTLFPGR